MEQLFLGVDGGGTKTAFLLTDAGGRALARHETAGASYKMYGIEAVVQRVREGAAHCLRIAGRSRQALAGCCLALPCFGESNASDALLQAELAVAFAPAPVYVCNDTEAAWAGSLACESGINIVAGTGSIAFGRDSSGKTARAGGWCEFFGDEGSCYWVGRRTMELFSKQADGRVPRGALYTLVREKFALTNDYEFMDVIDRDYAPYREKAASLQRLTEQAARAGDAAAAALYGEAAAELALAVCAVKHQLAFGGARVPVSYSGGLFRAGELILKPFTALLEAEDCALCAPRFSPVEGAALLATEKFGKE